MATVTSVEGGLTADCSRVIGQAPAQRTVHSRVSAGQHWVARSGETLFEGPRVIVGECRPASSKRQSPIGRGNRVNVPNMRHREVLSGAAEHSRSQWQQPRGGSTREVNLHWRLPRLCRWNRYLAVRRVLGWA